MEIDPTLTDKKLLLRLQHRKLAGMLIQRQDAQPAKLERTA
jgi:hypothetical protein